MFLVNISKWQNISFVANDLASVAMDKKGETRVQIEVACELGMFFGSGEELLDREDILKNSIMSVSEIGHMTSPQGHMGGT